MALDQTGSMVWLTRENVFCW